MTPRTIPPWLAGVVAELELERPTVVTMDLVRNLRERLGVRAPIGRIVEELHALGWLLKTGVHGAWEFVPGERAGAISSGDPFLPLRATLETAPDLPAFVALGSALWLLDIADRAPEPPEVALPKGIRAPLGLKRAYRTVHHDARLGPVSVQGLPVHRPATVLVHMATKPTDVRSWGNVLDCLPALMESSPEDEVRTELQDRPHATRVRLAYLVGGLSPDLIRRLGIEPAGKVWFGPRGPLRHHDAYWQVADTILPTPPPGTDGNR